MSFTLRLSLLAVRIAEKIGDPVGMGNALSDLGIIYKLQNRQEQPLDCSQKSLAIFEKTEEKKGKTRALLRIGLTHQSQGRFDQALEYYDKSLAISLETEDRNATALIFNNMGNVHYSLGRYELGLELLQKSRAHSEELNVFLWLAGYCWRIPKPTLSIFRLLSVASRGRMPIASFSHDLSRQANLRLVPG
jgi:tetratricopeptide (TPR) repeat protein